MTTMVMPRLPQQDTPAARSAGAAVLRGQSYRVLQAVLFVVGAVLLPCGLLVIGLGWYGAAHTPYLYDQMSYLVSGGLLGLGLTFTGGFLYFGAWLARIAADQRESARRMSDTLLVLADVVSRMEGGTSQRRGRADAAEIPVVAGEGTTVHRRDCSLIAHRSDLRVLQGTEEDLSTCRICRPVLT
jgi:hypothetical protein